MKKASIKIIFALFFAVCLTLQLSMGVFAARDAVGDLDGNGFINKDDAIHLLGNTIFSELYPVDQPCDYNKDGIIDKDDAIYLLGHTIFSDLYYICQHEDDKWTVSEVIAPTCNEEGYTVIVCECGETDKTDYTPVNAEAHVWEIKDNTHAATCLENGYIVMACDVCGLEETTLDLAYGHEYEVSCTEEAVCFTCEAVIPARGHSFDEEKTEVFEATCTEDGYNVYECEYCIYTYTEITAPATGHTAADTAWSAPVMQAVAEKECVYVWVETATCETCGETIERVSDEFTHHTEYVTVTEATCSEPGAKTVTCQTCSEVLSETEIPVNAEAHSWTEVSTEGNVVSYECSLCHGTKKTAATESGELTSLGDADEILVNNITIAPDATTSEQLSGLDIYVSADMRDVGDMDNINDEIAERLSESEVYSLTIKDANQDEITNFDGMVTVSIPYALKDGEDPDTIMVWYIDEDGNVTVIEDVEYRDGYIVFKTNHFSDYGVIRMTVAEICEAYGHNYIDSSVPATCMSGGYVGIRCSRCNDEQITEKLEALGHNWTETSSTEPTCDTPGETKYVCDRCRATYTATKAALGHDYQSDAGRYKEPTCTEFGKEYMVCSGCGNEYFEELPAIEHDDEVTVVDPDCVTAGYTKYVCKVCENERVTDTTLPLGHNYEDGKCTRCEHECEHDFYYGECKICGEDKIKDVPAGPDVPVEPDIPDDHEHEYSKVTVDGCERHNVYVYECDCGDISSEEFFADYSTFTEGFGDNCWTYTCPMCDIRIVESYTVSEKDENCVATSTWTYELYLLDTLLVETEISEIETRHNDVITVEFATEGAQSCEDGVILTMTCSDCGRVETESSKYHYTFSTPMGLGCEKHYLSQLACLCERFTSLLAVYDSFEAIEEDNRIELSCPDCDVVIEVIEEIGEKDENCRVEVTEYITLYNGSTLVHEYVDTYTRTMHDPEVREITVGCTEHAIVLFECSCGTFASASFDDNSFDFVPQDGKEIYTCLDCDIRVEIYSVTSENGENCTATKTWYYDVYFEGDLVDRVTKTETNTHHNFVVTSTVLAEGSDNCEDGVIVTKACYDCGYEVTGTFYYHARAQEYITQGCADHNIYYGGCACGKHSGVWYEWSTFDQTYENNKWTYSCSDCGIVLEETVLSETELEGCELEAEVNYRVTFEGYTVFDKTYKEIWTRHNTTVVATQLVEGSTTCTDGVRITEICSDCGYEETYTVYYHARVDTYVTVGCADHNVRYGKCACGEYGGVWFDRSTFDRTVIMGAPIYTCPECELIINQTEFVGKKDENCNAQVTQAYVITFGDEFLDCLEFNRIQQLHEGIVTSVTLMEGAETCEDGVTFTETCVNCGHVGTYETYYHLITDERVTVGCENHDIHYGACACGAESGVWFDWETFTETYEKDHWTYTCDECGIRLDEEFVSETDLGNCKVEVEWHYVVTFDGETVLDETVKSIQQSHNYVITEATLIDGATSCLDGVVLTRVCSGCGESKTYQSNYHSRVEESITDGCDAHNVSYGVCPCGENGGVWFDRNTFNRSNENGKETYSCSECSLMIELTQTIGEKDENCNVEYSNSYVICYDGKEIKSLSYETTGTRHNDVVTSAVLKEGSKTCEDGATVTRTCSDCGYTRTSEVYYHNRVEEYVTEGCADHNVSSGNCACGENGGLWFDYGTFSEEYENGKIIHTCAECDLRIERTETQSEKDENCNYTRTTNYKVYFGEEFICEESLEKINESHLTDFKIIPDECSEVTEADGTRTVVETSEVSCADCFRVFGKRQITSKYDATGLLVSEETKEYEYVVVDLEVTEVVLTFTSVEEYCYFELDGFDDSIRRYKYRYYEHLNTGGIPFLEEYTYTYDEEDPCLVTVQYMSTYDPLTTTTQTQHAKLTSDWVLSEGSVTCLDGVDRIWYCTLCGEETDRRYWGTGHRRNLYPEQVIDLTEYGSVCEEKLALYTCPCGGIMEFSWPENSDYDTHWFYENGREYRVRTCAVTDPACGFVWVEEIYSEIDDSCSSVTYKNFYFGVDLEAKTYKENYSFTLTSGTKQHTEVSERIYSESGYTENFTCEHCGQLLSTREYAIEDRYVTNTWMYYDNMTGTHCTDKEVHTYYVVLGIEELAPISYYYEDYDKDGNAYYWEQHEFTYPGAEAGDYCHRIRVTANSNGGTVSEEETQHIGSHSTISYYTCAEYVWTEACTACGMTETNRTPNYDGHNFYFDSAKGVYVCSTCGIENDNGADGNLLLTDVSYEGDGTSYIVNYYSFYDVDYVHSISLVADSLDAPVKLDDSLITNDRNYRLYIDAAGVAAVAKELGLDTCTYKLRVEFIPTDATALVYYITMDSHIYLFDENNSVIPENGCESGNGATIVHTCVFCGNSRSTNYYGHNYSMRDLGVEKIVDENGNTIVTIATTEKCERCGYSYTLTEILTYSPEGYLVASDFYNLYGELYSRTYMWRGDVRYETSLATQYGIETYEYDFEADIRTTTEESYGSYTRIEKRTITTDQLLYEKFVSVEGWWHEQGYMWHNGDQYTTMYKCDEYTETYEYDFENDVLTVNVTNKNGETYTYKQIISTGETIE